MAWLSAYLPADQASGIWDRATTAARALQGPTESRTLTQLRADNVADWLLGGTLDGTADSIRSPKAQVLVTVPVFALMGLTEEPATLDGYGPIPPSMARALVADGAESFHRVLTDPRDGAPLEIGRESYRIPKAMRQWLRLRDGKCPFPGCTNQSLDNEADHILAWANGGTTGISNLGQPCHKHHRLKHTTRMDTHRQPPHEPPGWTHPPAATTPANTPTGNHHPGRTKSLDRPPTGNLAPPCPRANYRRIQCRSGTGWRRLQEPEPVPYPSVPDFLWLTEQPLAGSGARSTAGSTG